MRLSPIILRIRASTTRFGNNVGGAAELQAAQDEAFQTKVPICYVCPMMEIPTADNTVDSGYDQEVTDVFGVVVCLDNRVDKQGLKAHDTLDDVRDELNHAILNWTIPGYETSVCYRGARLLEMNRTYLWWIFEYGASRRLDESAGVDPAALYGPFLPFETFWGYIQATHAPFAGIADFTTAEPPSPADGEVWLNMGTGPGSVTGQAVTRLTVYFWHAAAVPVAKWEELPFDLETRVELPS